MTKVLGWIAAGLLASGLVLGFLRIRYAEVNCGSVFVPTSKAERAKHTDAEEGGGLGDFCDDVRADARRNPLVLLVMGIALAGAAVHTSGYRFERKGWGPPVLEQDDGLRDG